MNSGFNDDRLGQFFFSFVAFKNKIFLEGLSLAPRFLLSLWADGEKN